jgi:hypothetical protein
MPKSSKIKWRQRDEDRANIEVGKANDKIKRERKRLEKKGIDPDYLPPLIDVHEYKEQMKKGTRSDFNRNIKHVEKLIENKQTFKPIISLSGNTVTEWEYTKVKSDVQHINRERRKRKEQIMNEPATTRGRDTGLKRGEMGDTRAQEYEPKSFNFDKIRSGREWRKYVESVEKQVRDSYYSEKNELYKQNYIKAVINVGLPDGDEIISIIEGLDPDTFFKIASSEEQANVDFVYDVVELHARSEIILEIWKNVADG